MDLFNKQEFLANCKNILNVNIDLIDKALTSIINYTKASKEKRVNLQDTYSQSEIWYSQLSKGIKEYSLYNTNYYIADLWSCWVIYSSKYLKNIQNKKSMINHSITDNMGKIDSIVDLGCGMGYTTAYLKTMYPEASIWGTNWKKVI